MPAARARIVKLAIGLTALAVVGVGIAVWRASSIVNPLLRAWAVKTIAEQSRGVYRLDMSRLHLNWLQRHVHIDSLRLSTNTATNVRRAHPLSDVTVVLYDCTLSGVRLTTLIRGAGLVARSLGCRVGNAAVIVTRKVRDTTVTPHPFLVFKSRVQLPSLLPRVRISHVTFPALGIDFRLVDARRGDTRLELKRLQWRMADFAIDPADSSTATRPLFSRSIELLGENMVAHPGGSTALRVGMLAANLSDSTLEARDVVYEPTLTQAEFARLHPYRRDYITITAGRVRAQGLDVGALVLGEGARARRVGVDSFRADVTTDWHRPSRHRVHRWPQQWLADLDQSVSLDSVVLQEGEIVYREDRPGHVRPGAVTFAHLQATAVNVRHVNGRRARGDAMALITTSLLQNAGRFDVGFTVPLDAPSFDMTFRGTLGAMPATALNRFIQEVFPWRIAAGEIAKVDFAAVVTNGVADGMITPLYTGLAVDVTRKGSKGILGTPGIVGHTVRDVASLATNLTMVKDDNPAHRRKPPRTGTIHHVFTPQETLPGFLWASVRDGLLLVIRK